MSVNSEGREVCHSCGQTINNREISLFSGMVKALFEVAKWCKDNNQYEFTRKDIKHLLKDDGQIARFGDWVLFGGIVYKKGKGHYGINIDRARKFYANQLEIPIVVLKSPKGDISPIKTGKILDVPNLSTFLDENLMFKAVYHS